MATQWNHFSMKLAWSRIYDLQEEAYVAYLERQQLLMVVSLWFKNLRKLFRTQSEPQATCCGA